MIRGVLIGLALLCLAIPARSQDVLLRSGEHGDFTRLTLSLPRRTAWSVLQSAGKALVKFETDRLNVDTSATFDRIPRGRVRNVFWNKNENSLEIELGCSCAVAGFWYGAAMLVLDIREGPKTVAPDIKDFLSSLEGQTGSGSRATDMLIANLNTTHLPLDTTGERVSSSVGTSGLDAARTRLMKQFSRAASQGLITPRKTQSDPGKTRKLVERRLTPSKTEMDSQTDEPPSRTNLRAQSSIDRDFLKNIPGLSENILGQACLPDNRIDVGSWGTDATFGEQVSDYRRRLTGEFDDVNIATALGLARLYIFFSFGAEAKNILRGLPRDTPDLLLLLQLAEIADKGYVEQNAALADQLACDSPAALWSALSFRSLPQNTPLNRTAILRSFSALPPHLRTRFGPILSRRFLDVGYGDVGKDILNILDRPDHMENAEESMAKAQTELLSGQILAADQLLEQVANGNSRFAAEALVKLVEGRVRRNEATTFEQAQLAAAYGFELRGDRLAPALWAAHIRALAGSGEFGQAFAAFNADIEKLPSDELPELESDLLRLLSDRADDITFLKHVLAGEGYVESDLSPGLRNRLARRLVDLGFSDQAAQMLANDGPEGPERKLLRAEIALRSNKPRLALVELLDLDGPEANLLRADALSASDEHAPAYQLYASTGHADLARREAWLQGDWNNAILPDEPAYAAFADLRSAGSSKNPETASDQALLAQNRKLIEESDSMRATIKALLRANPSPENAPPDS